MLTTVNNRSTILKQLLAILSAVVLGLLIIKPNVLILAIVSVTIAFFLFLIKPFWCVIFVIIMHFWFGSIEYGVYPRIWSIFLLGIIVILRQVYYRPVSLYTILKQDKYTKVIIEISVALFIWQIVCNIMNNIGLSSIGHLFVRIVSPLVLAISIYLLLNNKKIFSRFINYIILAITVSALIGLFQSLQMPFAWQIREMIGGYLHNKPEPSGLALYSLHYAYQLSTVIPIIFVKIVSSEERTKKVLYTLICILFILALFPAEVRSAMLGTALAILVSIFHLKKKSKYLVITAVIGVLVVSMSFTLNLLSRTQLTLEDESAKARIPLFLTALEIAQDNPIFGVGSGRYSTTAQDYFYRISYMTGARTVLRTSAHNQFLNILVYYGLPGFILVVFFYYIMIKRLHYIVNTTEDPQIKQWGIGLLGSQVSYITNSSFHNMGPFISDPYIWFFIGAIFVLFKFGARRKSI